jgi:hypothetical protein
MNSNEIFWFPKEIDIMVVKIPYATTHWLLFTHRHARSWQKLSFYIFGVPILAVQVFF